MKIALVTTTINVPHVLALYAKYGPDVMMFIVGDRKTDDIAVVNFLFDHCPNHMYYGIDVQHQLYPKLSRLIGENCIQRRNIGTLEAAKWGADVIVMIDDDNIPLNNAYFDNTISPFFVTKMTAQMPHGCVYPIDVPTVFNGLKASSPSGWFDVGQLLQPHAEHRGFPHTKRAQASFEGVTDAKIGVAAGICMGDPDIGAVERIANGPIVHGVSEILRSGVVTDPRETWTVFNSQNTAFIRELAPAMFMLPGVGRYDDIFASLICQRVMREKGLHVHFGRPFVWQQRNQHDLTKDLVAEVLGMQTIERFADWLANLEFAHGGLSNSVEFVRYLFEAMPDTLLPGHVIATARDVWCDEIEKVM